MEGICHFKKLFSTYNIFNIFKNHSFRLLFSKTVIEIFLIGKKCVKPKNSCAITLFPHTKNKPISKFQML